MEGDLYRAAATEFNAVDNAHPASFWSVGLSNPGNHLQVYKDELYH
ncbi:MAG: hypothetical protein R3C28_07150 [Pirellulaceae bacterium]